MEYKLFFLINSVFIITVNAQMDMIYDRDNVFDSKLYEEVLDREECLKQIRYIVTNDPLLWARFLDAGLRMPRSLQKGNLNDLGSYYECLGINKNVQDMNIEGKYCMAKIPVNQLLNLSSLPIRSEFLEVPLPEFNPVIFNIDNSTYNDLIKQMSIKKQLQKLVGTTLENNDISRDKAPSLGVEFSIQLAVCLPKPCSLQNALNTILDLQPSDLMIEEEYCRIPNDKQWVAADYVALVIFILLSILVILSTVYDIRHQILLKKDPKSVNKLYQSFSVYTNTLRLVTYKPVPGALECLDGIRAFAMMWVIIGHTFVNYLVSAPLYNPLDAVDFIQSFWSLWIMSAPITVDTFFMLSGLLLVYSTAGKMTGLKLMQNLHLFYLNRYLRLFPVLAACILLQASLFHRVSDGPAWETVAAQTDQCRKYWWSTLLYIQNYYKSSNMCLPHTWYLAIDFQLFLISPLILFWVVSGKKQTAWITLTTALLVSLVGSSIYNFIIGFGTGNFTLNQREDQPDYFTYYYVNTLTRASPFFVGMIFGYILHIYRGKVIIISKVQIAVLWLLAIILSSGVIYSYYPVVQQEWDNQTVDNVLNSYMRPIWALSVCWMIFACAHGYGGPINWLLSHPMWKILGRLSYAMYIFHFPLMIIVNGTSIAPLYFTTEFAIQKFMTDFVIAVLAAYLITLYVDAPCSVLIKHFLGGNKRPAPIKPLDDIANSSAKNINDNVESPKDF
ncbi:O-acyltransferase like protein-like [Galleria mellonella]|uniref:O-acyltransferase like protein-like n=1 Tax=Galleria mellonella TaxID=7137 RepID=A0ABM3MXT5_GALME|nr:O-acyltransferase like protein-like [Galleria mellonella]